MRQRRSGAWIAIPWAVGTAAAGMALAALGGVDVVVQWYLTLRKPEFQPPAWVFGPAWSVIFALAPLSCVYYPITILPAWLQPVAWALPSTHVFEGMRAVLFEHTFRTDYFLGAVALDIVYLAAGAALFFIAFRDARRRGALLQMGE